MQRPAAIALTIRATTAGHFGVVRPRSGLDSLDLELQRDLVRDDHAAVGQRRVEVDVKVAPVDLSGGREAGPHAAVRVRPEAVELEAERNALGDALEGQVAVED